jgi:N utilization substance protein A
MDLLYKNVPEINEGLIEVKKLARFPGERSKLVVKAASSENAIQPIGTIIGPGGSRINAIKKELNGERIDVILYNDDLKTLIMNLCAPVRLVGIRITDKLISLVVDDNSYQTKNGRSTNNALQLVGPGGLNIQLIRKIVEVNVEVITPKDAEEVEISYEPVDYSNSSIGNRNNSFRNNNEQHNNVQIKKVVDLGVADFDDFINDKE